MRGADVFIIQSHGRTPGRSVNDSLVEQWIMIDAAKRASAKRITAVCPYYGYSRQDRKSKGREPITARMVSDFFAAAGADRIISVDLHSGQIQGFFDGPVDHLTAVPLLTDYLRLHAPSGDFVMVAPDTGRTKVAEQAARHAGERVDVAAVYKRRPKDAVNQVQTLGVMGDVDGRMCVLIDDMIDTAGTICAAADLLLDKGATEVWAMATHAVLSDPATDRLKNSAIARVVVTDTLPLPPGEADRQDRGGLGGPDLRRRHRRRVRRRVGLADLRRREPDLSRRPLDSSRSPRRSSSVAGARVDG